MCRKIVEEECFTFVRLEKVFLAWGQAITVGLEGWVDFGRGVPLEL